MPVPAQMRLASSCGRLDESAQARSDSSSTQIRRPAAPAPPPPPAAAGGRHPSSPCDSAPRFATCSACSASHDTTRGAPGQSQPREAHSPRASLLLSLAGLSAPLQCFSACGPYCLVVLSPATVRLMMTPDVAQTSGEQVYAEMPTVSTRAPAAATAGRRVNGSRC